MNSFDGHASFPDRGGVALHGTGARIAGGEDAGAGGFQGPGRAPDTLPGGCPTRLPGLDEPLLVALDFRRRSRSPWPSMAVAA